MTSLLAIRMTARILAYYSLSMIDLLLDLAIGRYVIDHHTNVFGKISPDASGARTTTKR